jgi:hypothetical protein
MIRLTAATIATGIALIPSLAVAQGMTYATLSISTRQVYEDNLFIAGSPEGQSDLVISGGPAVEAGYVARPLKIMARYAFEADRYTQHPSLSRALARQEAAVAIEQRPTRRLFLDVRTSYLTTHTPTELNADSALIIPAGHRRAERLLTASKAVYDWTPATQLALDYTFSRDDLRGGVAGMSHEARVGLVRQSAPRSTARLAYGLRHFTFDAGRAEVWHLLTTGWSHEVTRQTTIEIIGGPRVSSRTVRPELNALIRRRFQRGELAAGYSSTQTIALGQTGALDVHRLDISASYRPTPNMTVSVGPAAAISSRDGVPISVYTLNIDAVRRMRGGLSVVVSGSGGLQQGTLVGGARPVPYHRVSVGLVATLPSAVRVPRSERPS